jgi:UDP-glucose 4-epimerase
MLFGLEDSPVPGISKHVRDVQVSDFEGFEALVHRATLSNDPLGDLNPECTYDIKHRPTVRVGAMRQGSWVHRFLFSSSCSLYGKARRRPVGGECQI